MRRYKERGRDWEDERKEMRLILAEGGTNIQRDGKNKKIKSSKKRHQDKEGDTMTDEIQRALRQGKRKATTKSLEKNGLGQVRRRRINECSSRGMK